MEVLDVAEIYIWDEFVGAIQWDNVRRQSAFQYDEEFLKLGWDLSPIQLPISNKNLVYQFPKTKNLLGLPDVLFDSIPPGFANDCIEAWLSYQDGFNPVHKLCFLGTRGFGALEFEPILPTDEMDYQSVDLESIIKITRELWQSQHSFLANMSIEEWEQMKNLLPKIPFSLSEYPQLSITYNAETGEMRAEQSVLEPGFEHWLMKLDVELTKNDAYSLAEWHRVEHAYAQMARDCGIEVCETKLVERNGRTHLLTKRLDRKKYTKYHVQSLAAIRGFDYQENRRYSYEKVFETMRQLKLPYPEMEQFFRRMVFNVLATNYSDHAGTIHFRLKKGRNWQLAPAQHLCFSYRIDNPLIGWQALSVNGKRLGIHKVDLIAVAKENGIKKAERIISEINNTITNWQTYAEQAEINIDLRETIQRNLNTY